MSAQNLSEREIELLAGLGKFFEGNPAIARDFTRQMIKDEKAIQAAAKIRHLFNNCTNAGRWSDIAFDVRMFGI